MTSAEHYCRVELLVKQLASITDVLSYTAVCFFCMFVCAGLTRGIFSFLFLNMSYSNIVLNIIPTLMRVI